MSHVPEAITQCLAVQEHQMVEQIPRKSINYNDCGQAYSLNAEFLKNRRIYETEKRFTCPICFASFDLSDPFKVTFDKVVVVRFTTNGWATQDQIVANYSHCLFATDNMDAFNITTAIPVKLTEGKCEFYVQYQVAGEEFWDNNDSQNYIVNVALNSSSSTCPLFLQRYGTSLESCSTWLQYSSSTKTPLETWSRR